MGGDLLPSLTPQMAAAIAAVVFVSAMVQSGLGMGFGLASAPILALIDHSLAPAPVLWLGFVTSAWGALRELPQVRWGEVRLGVFGRMAGVVLAALVLSRLEDPRLFLLAFGSMIALAVLLSLSGLRFAFNRASLLAMSTLSGFMGTITSVGAPPMALIYQNRGAGEARPTLAAFFTVGSILSLGGLWFAGRNGLHEMLLAFAMAPPMVLGMLAGRRLESRFSKRYRPALLMVAGVSALLLIYRGLA